MGLSEKLVYGLPIKMYLIFSNHIPSEEMKAISGLPGSFNSESRSYNISRIILINNSNEYSTTIRPFLGRDVDVIGIPEDAIGDLIHDKLKTEFPGTRILRLPRPTTKTSLEDYLSLIDQKLTDSLQ